MNNNENSPSAPQTTPADDLMQISQSPPSSTRFRSNKWLLIILVSIALTLLILVVTYVYWFQNPNKVVSDAMGNALSAKTLNYTGVVTSTGTPALNVAVDGGMSINGGIVHAKFSFDTQNKTYTLTGNGLFAENGDAYVKVKDIDKLVGNYRSAIPAVSQPLFDQIIDKVADKWIKVSSADIENYNKDFAVAQRCTIDSLKKIQSDAATKAELIGVYKKHPFIEVNKVLGARNDSLGYSLKINHDASRAFTAEYKKIPFYKALVACDESYTVGEDIAQQKTATSTDVAVDVWVSRWTHVLTKVEMRDNMKTSKTDVSIDTKFNHPVAIDIPKNATSLDKLQNDVQALLRSAQAD
jgi:hypothetical protein